MQAATSATPEGCATIAGRCVIIPFQMRHAGSYPGSVGAMSGNLSRAWNACCAASSMVICRPLMVFAAMAMSLPFGRCPDRAPQGNHNAPTQAIVPIPVTTIIRSELPSRAGP
jgi:hypothetical protein